MIAVILASGADDTKRLISVLIIALLLAAFLVAALTTWYWMHTNPRRRYRPAVPGGAGGPGGAAPEALRLRRPYDPSRPPYDPSRAPYDPSRPTPDRLRQGPYGYGQPVVRDQARRGGPAPGSGAYGGGFGSSADFDTDQFGNRYTPVRRQPRNRRGR